MTPGEVTQIEQLRRSLDDLTATIKRRNAWRRVLAVLAAVAVGVLLANSVANRTTLAIVRDATNPQGQLARSGQDRQQVVLAGLLDEGDCRHRRAAAGLPPPPNIAKPCRDQTDPSVYPGGGASTSAPTTTTTTTKGPPA